MANQTCVHCYITGRVQGVWFRATTKKEADRLGLFGWVRNLPDGRVEVLMCGEREKVEALCEWLKKGPPLAKVSEVQKEELPWEVHEEFVVL